MNDKIVKKMKAWRKQAEDARSVLESLPIKSRETSQARREVCNNLYKAVLGLDTMISHLEFIDD